MAFPPFLADRQYTPYTPLAEKCIAPCPYSMLQCDTAARKASLLGGRRRFASVSKCERSAPMERSNSSALLRCLAEVQHAEMANRKKIPRMIAKKMLYEYRKKRVVES